MRSRTVLLSVVLAGMIACQAPARAEDQAATPIEITKAAEPAKEEPKPLGTVSPEAQQLLEQISDSYKKLNSLELAGVLTLVVQDSGQNRPHESRFTSLFQSPNKFRHEISNQPLFGSTGAKVYAYSAHSNLFLQVDAPAGRNMLQDLPDEHAKVLAAQNLSLVLAMSKDPTLELRQLASSIDRLPSTEIDGKACDALKLQLNEAGNAATLLFDGASHLMRRVTVDMKPVLEQVGRPDIASASLRIDYQTIKPDAELKGDAFAWLPPAGAKDYLVARAEAVAAAQADADEDPSSALAGKPAPNFTLARLDGKQLSLADLKGSVVILDFWATWCGPCVASLPHLDKIYQDHQKAGLKVFAVDLREAREKVQQFVDAKNLSIPVLMDTDGAVAKLYFVQGIPQTVVIGKDGKVKKVLVGFNPDGDDALRQVISDELKAKPDARPPARPAGRPDSENAQ
jgi:peroxiredoxin